MEKQPAIALIALLVFGISACTAPPSGLPAAQAPPTAHPNLSPSNTSPVDTPAVVDNKRSLPAGTVLRVRLYHAIDTNRTQFGDSFVGSLSTPVTLEDKTVLPKGTVVRGSVKSAEESGRLKGRGSVSLTLDRMEYNGSDVRISTNDVTWTSADHKKRNLAWIGGGSAAGALVGALLGGGKGAAVGAAAGGGAGVAGAATTGKRQVRIPAESVLTFRLERPVAI